MLILQRRPDEAVLIGDDIRVVILQSDGGGVRIGIEAPSDVSILREEIVDEVRSETVRASRAALDSLGGLKPPAPLPSGDRAGAGSEEGDRTEDPTPPSQDSTTG